MIILMDKRIRTQQLPLEVPAIKIRNIDAEIRDITYDVIADKVIVQGIIHKQIFYVGIDNLIHHQAEDMPFSTFVDVPGALPGMFAQININIEKVIAHLLDDGTVIQQKVILEIFVKVEQEDVINLSLGETGELVELNQFIADAEKQIIESNELLLNQTAEKVTEIRADIRDLETEVITDKIIIQGVIHKQIFYINANGEAVHQSEDISFSTFIDIAGAEPGMNLFVRPDIEFIDYQLLDGGTVLVQNIVLEIYTRISQFIQERVSQGNLLTKLPVVIGENTKQVMETNQITLEEPVLKVKEIVAEIRDLNYEIILNKVIIQGIIHKQVYYIGLDGIEYHQREDISFSTFIDIPAVFPGNDLRIDAQIEDVIFELIGENILQQKVVIELFAKAVELNQLNIMVSEPGIPIILPIIVAENNKQILVESEISIIIPPVDEVNIEYETIVNIEQLSACQQAIVENTVELNCAASKVVKILADVEGVEAELINETLVSVSGNIVKDIAYVCDNRVFHIQEIVPFNVNVSLDDPIEGGELNPNVIIEHISFELLDGGELLRQLIIIEACIGPEIIEFVNVVTSITGPGITTETVMVEEEIIVSENPLKTGVEQFPVVTDVNDPQNLLSVIEKEVLVLNVVNQGHTPIEVVVFAG